MFDKTRFTKLQRFLDNTVAKQAYALQACPLAFNSICCTCIVW